MAAGLLWLAVFGAALVVVLTEALKVLVQQQVGISAPAALEGRTSSE